MKLTLKYFSYGLKKQLQYKMNFIILCIAVAPLHLLQLVFSVVLILKFKTFDGWALHEIAFLYGLLLTPYSIAQIFFRQFRYLDMFIQSGNLDIYLTKPISVVYSLVFNNLSLMEVFSQLLPSFVALFVIMINANIHWSITKITILISAITGGAIIQSCIFVIIGTLSFWTTKSSETEKIFFTFKQFLNYPISAYGKQIVFILTYILPLGFINYYPALVILEKKQDEILLGYFTIPVSICVLVLTRLFWKIGMKNYSSTGS